MPKKQIATDDTDHNHSTNFIRYTSTDFIFHLSNYIFFILPYNSFKSNDDLEYFLKNFLAPNIQNKK